MRSAERRAHRIALPWLALVLALSVGSSVQAQVIEPSAVFSSTQRATSPSAEEILRRALDNLFGFDAAITLEIERRVPGRPSEMSEFFVQRRRMRDAQRLLAVSVRPTAVRGNRVLQINYDDGREETFAFVPTASEEPMRTRYRLAEPFLATWYEIGLGEPSASTRARAEYEVLGLEPVTAAGEDAYRLLLRSIAPRGYDRTELVVARSDYALLEQRHYLNRSPMPVLSAVVTRADMVRFADHVVPARIAYQDRVQNVTLEVRVRHAQLPEGSDPLFVPGTFHRVMLPALSGSGSDASDVQERR